MSLLQRAVCASSASSHLPNLIYSKKEIQSWRCMAWYIHSASVLDMFRRSIAAISDVCFTPFCWFSSPRYQAASKLARVFSRSLSNKLLMWSYLGLAAAQPRRPQCLRLLIQSMLMSVTLVLFTSAALPVREERL